LTKEKGCDVAVCGHIHQPKLDVDYMNSGDFCENSTCLVEDFKGNWQIITVK
jgi:UDP-2,3-diacylglucosamine pyrophosphatase LpxH